MFLDGWMDGRTEQPFENMVENADCKMYLSVVWSTDGVT